MNFIGWFARVICILCNTMNWYVYSGSYKQQLMLWRKTGLFSVSGVFILRELLATVAHNLLDVVSSWFESDSLI